MPEYKNLPFRPLRPGEKITNPDGTYSTEVTATFETPNGWMVVPQLYLGPNGLMDLRGQGETALGAAMYLQNNHGIVFPTFKSLEEANAFTQKRTKAGGVNASPLVKGLLE